MILARTSGGAFVLAIAAIAAVAFGADVAVAAQGPGTAAGSASSLTQSVMALIVYGTSALVVGVGLIGALRQR